MHKTNSWEEKDVERGKKLQKEGHLEHAKDLFDDAHGSYNYNGHNSTGAEHNHAAKNTGAIYEGFHNERKKMTHPFKNMGNIFKGYNHPLKMSEEISDPVLSDDMNLTGKSYTSDEGGSPSIMPPIRNMYGMSKK